MSRGRVSNCRPLTDTYSLKVALAVQLIDALHICATLQHVLEKLPAELKAQQKNHAVVAARLKAQSDAWLRNTPGLRHFADTFVLHWCGACAWSVLSHVQQLLDGPTA